MNNLLKVPPGILLTINIIVCKNILTNTRYEGKNPYIQIH